MLIKSADMKSIAKVFAKTAGGSERVKGCLFKNSRGRLACMTGKRKAPFPLREPGLVW